MRAVIQKVSRAHVDVLAGQSRERSGQIEAGLMVLLGVCHADTEADARYIADKIAGLRIFEDEAGKLNRSVQDIGGAVLLVSQFTLYADARNGRRPSFSQAARPEAAEPLYETVAGLLRRHGLQRHSGPRFVERRHLLGAHHVELLLVAAVGQDAGGHHAAHAVGNHLRHGGGHLCGVAAQAQLLGKSHRKNSLVGR